LECDGAKYHESPEAYAWDHFRQKQLEQFGFTFYRLWSTKWWDAADRELQSLLTFISEHGNGNL
jgi:very-short-patch-repair endonuclease